MNTTPENAAWVKALIAQEVEQAVAPLRQKMDELDDWANGVFAALADVLPPLLKSQPEIARYLEPMWRDASERYDRIGSIDQADDFDETQELLEARKVLYRQLALLKAWPAPVRES